MRIYITPNSYECHTTNPDGIYREIVLSESAEAFFANKCEAFIEGYRVKPEGETWVRDDGAVFSGGEMITPWKPYSELDAAQREYERAMLAQLKNIQNDLNISYQEGINSI